MSHRYRMKAMGYRAMCSIFAVASLSPSDSMQSESKRNSNSSNQQNPWSQWNPGCSEEKEWRQSEVAKPQLALGKVGNLKQVPGYAASLASQCCNKTLQ